MPHMEKVTLRRTFNIANYEGISVEATGEGETLDQARLCAAQKVLEMARQEMTRIFGLRPYNTNNDPFQQVQLELQGLAQELQQKGR